MAGKILISGAGISGLLSALLLARRGRGTDVVLVDKCPEPGGLLRRFRYGAHGDFDYGMHNMLQTGIDDLDDLVFGLLPEEDWQLLEGSQRDLAGIFINGRLQRNTPYVDLRSLSPEDYRACLAGFLEHMDRHHDIVESRESARHYLVDRFGPTVAETALLPALEKIHRKPAGELDYMASVFTPMTRIAFCDEPLVRELTASPWLRERVAWSDQRTLPLERSSGRRAYYPVKYGMYRIVDSMVGRLRAAGVQMFLGAEIASLKTEKGRVQGAVVRQDGRDTAIEGIDQLIWTANIPLLGAMLGMDLRDMARDPQLRTVVVSMIVDKPLEGMGDLFHFFCYTPGFHTYRLTNFVNYCRGAPRNGGLPITIELLLEDELARKIDLEATAKDELFRFGVTAPNTQVLFAKAEFLDSGFPMPSRNNIRLVRHVRDGIAAMGLENLELAGILARDNLFFQTDVMIDIHGKLAG